MNIQPLVYNYESGRMDYIDFRSAAHVAAHLLEHRGWFWWYIRTGFTPQQAYVLTVRRMFAPFKDA